MWNIYIAGMCSRYDEITNDDKMCRDNTFYNLIK